MEGKCGLFPAAHRHCTNQRAGAETCIRGSSDLLVSSVQLLELLHTLS